MSEDLALRFLLLFLVEEIFQRVGHQKVRSVVKVGILLVVLVVGVLFGLLPAVFYAVGRYVALLLV